MAEPAQETANIDTGLVASVMDRIFEADPNTPALESATPPSIIPKEELAKVDAPVKQEPVKSDVKDDLPEELPNAGRSEAWKKFRGEHNTLKKEFSVLKEQLIDFEGSKKEKQELKAKLTSYEEQIGKLKEVDSLARLENDPDFQAKYVTARKTASDKLNEYASLSDIDQKDLSAALNKTGKEKIQALEDILSSAPSVLKNKIIGIIDQIENIDAERQIELSTAQESLSKRQQERQTSQAKARQEFEEKAGIIFKETSEELSKRLGIDASIIDKARELFTKNQDLKVATETIIKGLYADTAIKDRDALKKERDELKAELQKYQESNPGLGAGSRGGLPDFSKDVDFIEAIKAGAKEIKIY